MHARPGDWLVVKSRTDHSAERRALVLAVHGADGKPPFEVRWTDDGHQGLVYPGPDAVVVGKAEQVERDRRESSRIAAIQSTLTARKGSGSRS